MPKSTSASEIQSNLNELKPDPETNFSRVHAVLCRVLYPDEGAGRPKATGLLLYLKLSVTGNEPELIKRYRTNHPDFPHQTTLDQFFDEEQFEAYHQLGVHIADGLFSRALMSGNTEPHDSRTMVSTARGQPAQAPGNHVAAAAVPAPGA